MTDYPDNFVLYGWASEWFRQQKKNLEGAEYFERMYSKQINRSGTLAKYALLEKADLLVEQKRKTEAVQALERIKVMPGSDPLISMKVQILEKEARKR
jgi:hypothetical protein